jgi:hypothetical protein
LYFSVDDVVMDDDGVFVVFYAAAFSVFVTVMLVL